MAGSALVGCSAGPAEPEGPPPPDPGATVGVLLTEDLPDEEWTGPLWNDWDALDAAHPGVRYPWSLEYCLMPHLVRVRPPVMGLLAGASAAWSRRDEPGLVLSTAYRFRRSTFARDVPDTIRYNLARCLDEHALEGAEAVLGGTAEAPVLDYARPEDDGVTWHHRVTWTMVGTSVVVVLAATWRGDAEPPADLTALLPAAVERAATLPATSPRPGEPPACEDC